MLECQEASSRGFRLSADAPVAPRRSRERVKVATPARAVWFLVLTCVGAVMKCLGIAANLPQFLALRHGEDPILT